MSFKSQYYNLNENFDNLHKLGVKIVIRGSIEKLDKSLKSKIINAQNKTLNKHFFKK